MTEYEAEDSAKEAEQNALGEQLADQPHTPGTKRDADRNLLPANARAGKKQIGHVGTGDEQHERHDGHQQNPAQHHRLPLRSIAASSKGVTVRLFPSLAPGYSFSRAAPEIFISACAWASVIPG